VNTKLDYGNWVGKKFIYAPAIIGVVLLAAGIFFNCIYSIIGGIIFLLISAYFVYARYKFSPSGGDIQGKIQELVLEQLNWNGKGQALDIGCGNGPLTILLAKKFPESKATGTDFWGGMWEYSKSVCEQNASVAKVQDQVEFKKASASALPYPDESFDAAVSNLCFHEVAYTKDKRKVIKEALRVVKKGGAFAFQDLFLMKPMFGEIDDLLKEIKSWGIEKVEFVDTSNFGFIPRALKLPFMVGTIGIIYGIK
jgi:ubiquinone/menaquinone biosynthesis C-methylase UbiE